MILLEPHHVINGDGTFMRVMVPPTNQLHEFFLPDSRAVVATGRIRSIVRPCVKSWRGDLPGSLYFAERWRGF